MPKADTLIDATLVETSVARPPRREGAASTLDSEAGFTRRGQRSFFGFKAHLAVDLGSDLVRSAILTGADVSDSLAADALVQGDEDAVFADKAYDSAARREALAEAGIVDAIMHRGAKGLGTAAAPMSDRGEPSAAVTAASPGTARTPSTPPRPSSTSPASNCSSDASRGRRDFCGRL